MKKILFLILCLFFNFNSIFADDTDITVTTSKAGIFQALYEAQNPADKILKLIITGPINGKDIAYIRSLKAVDVSSILKRITLDISNATIVGNDTTTWVAMNGSAVVKQKCSCTQDDVVPSYMFTGTEFGNVIFPNSVKKIDDNACDIAEYLSYATIGKNTTEIGTCAFYGDKFLRGIFITQDHSLKTIGEQAFYKAGQGRFNTIVIPDGVDTIGAQAFEGCTSVNRLYLYPSVKSLGWAFLDGVSTITEIHFLSNEAPDFNVLDEGGGDAFSGFTLSDKLVVYIPIGSYDSYFNAFDKTGTMYTLSSDKMVENYISMPKVGNLYIRTFSDDHYRTAVEGLDAYYIDNMNIVGNNGYVSLSPTQESIPQDGTLLDFTGASNDTVIAIASMYNDAYSIINANAYLSELHKNIRVSETTNTIDIWSPITDVVSSTTTSNYLIGTGVSDKIVSSVNGDNYQFYFNGDGAVFSEPLGFYHCSETTVKSHHAYLCLPSSMYAQGINDPILIKNLSTSIHAITNFGVNKTPVKYSLQGIRIKEPIKGIYISNGKKYIK